MILSFPLRLQPHFVDFGYRVDALTRRDCRMEGRDRQRLTRDFPEDCFAIALPARVAAHVSALPDALQRADGVQEALLMLPAQTLDADNRARAAHVAFTRLELRPDEEEEAARPGDTIRSRALLVDAADVAKGAPDLLPHLARHLTAEPVPIGLGAAERLGVEREMLVIQRGPVRLVRDASPAARRMVAALVAGARLRLGPAECQSQQAFWRALADALAALPPRLRAHVSASTGWTRPDDAVQIAWCLDFIEPAEALADPLVGLPDDMPLEVASQRLFRDPIGEGPAIEHVDPAARIGGYVMAHRQSAGIAAELRRFIAVHAETTGSPVVATDAETLALLFTAGDGSGSSTPGGLAAALATADSALLTATRDRLVAAGELDAVTALDLLTSRRNLDRRPSLDALALGGRIADLARDAGLDDFTEAARRRIDRELRAAVLAQPLLPLADLGVIVASPTLSVAVAGMLERGDETLQFRLRQGLALAEMVGAEGADLARRARQRLLPRDARAGAHWTLPASTMADPLDLALSLIDAQLDNAEDPTPMLWPLCERLFDLGRANDLIQVITAGRARLCRADAGDAVFVRSLVVINRVSAMLLRPAAQMLARHR